MCDHLGQSEAGGLNNKIRVKENSLEERVREGCQLGYEGGQTEVCAQRVLWHGGHFLKDKSQKGPKSRFLTHFRWMWLWQQSRRGLLASQGRHGETILMPDPGQNRCHASRSWGRVNAVADRVPELLLLLGSEQHLFRCSLTPAATQVATTGLQASRSRSCCVAHQHLVLKWVTCHLRSPDSQNPLSSTDPVSSIVTLSPSGAFLRCCADYGSSVREIGQVRLRRSY